MRQAVAGEGCSQRQACRLFSLHRATCRYRAKASLPPIKARLVAALVSRPLPVTGWALPDVDDTTGELTASGGARATHLAVPAGSVYYFQCENHEAAKQLAAALNWHGVLAQS